jgi:PAS domain S-box-containing protein
MDVTGHHDVKLVAISVIIAIICSYSSLHLSLAARQSERNIVAWRLLGTATIGIGIWAVHFIGMLGYPLGVPIYYHKFPFVFSFLFAIISAFFALYFVSDSKPTYLSVAFASICMGISIVAMHYIGMASLETRLAVHYNPYVVLLSIAIAFSASFLSLFFSFLFVTRRLQYNSFKKIISSVLIGSGISAMHYTAMKGVSFCCLHDYRMVSHSSHFTVSTHDLAYGIGFITAAILLLHIWSIHLDQQKTLNYKCLMDYNPMLVLSANLQGTITSINLKGIELLGEHMKVPLYSIFPKKEYKKIRTGLKKIKQGDSCHFSASIIDKYGKEIPMQITFVPIVRNETTIGLFLIGNDITELIKYKERIKKAQRDLLDTVHQQQGLIFKFVKSGDSFVHTLCGGELLHKLGLSSRDVVGKTLYDIFPASVADEKMTYYRRAWEGETIYHEVNMGDITYLSCLRPIKKDGKVIEVIGSAIDITERKRMEQGIIQAKEEAEKANSAKSELISKMSHELRTPLNSVLGFAQLLEMDRSLSSQQREFVQEIINGARHLVNLVNEILDLARIETGKLSITYDVVHPSFIIEESIRLIQPSATKRNIQIINEARFNEHDYVYTDPTRFRQILLNLLDNAVKYNRENGTVIVTSKRENGEIYIHIKDTGIGIPEDQYEKIFEPFYRIKGTGVEGTGIGLAFAKQLIQLIGGTIGVKSELGVGSDFWVCFPVAENADISKNLSNYYTNLYKERLSKVGIKYILYIEDNIANLKLMENILNPFHNFVLLSAKCGKEGLDIAFREKVDLILVDMDLPDISGYEVLEHLQQNEKTRYIPVVAISANAMSGEIQKALSKGFNDYVTKPLDVEAFLEKLEQIFTQTNAGEKHPLS